MNIVLKFLAIAIGFSSALAIASSGIGGKLPSELPVGFEGWPAKNYSCKFSATATRETNVHRRREGERLTIVAVSLVMSGDKKHDPHMVIYKDNTAGSIVNFVFYNDGGEWKKFEMVSSPSHEEQEVAKRIFAKEGMPEIAPSNCS